jgi:glycosyltransferase involved in cell wall biosynthesis
VSAPDAAEGDVARQDASAEPLRAPPVARIAFYLPQFSSSSGHLAALRIAREVARRGFSVAFIVDRAGGDMEASFASFPTVCLGVVNTALAGPALAAAAASASPDILVAVGAHNILTAALMKRVGLLKPRLIGWEHGVLSAMRVGRRVRGALETQLARALYGACERIIFPSQGAAADATAVLAPHAIRTAWVHDPLPTPLWQPLSPAERTLARRLQSPRVVTLGQLDRTGDHMTLLRAFQLFARAKGGSLLIIGDGERRSALEAAAVGLGLGGRVHFAGAVEHPSNLLALGELFVAAALSDARGAHLVEALTQGLPVVAMDCPTAPREVLADGRFGRLTPPGDARGLSRAMRETLERPVEPDLLRARGAEFSAERATDAFLGAIESGPARETDASRKAA